MKLYLILTFMVLSAFRSFCQNSDSIKIQANEAVKAFAWDVEKSGRGTLMFLDVPYQRDKSDSIEYLTLTVAKGKANKRPDFISIIIPNNVVQSNGIFIKFAKSVTRNGESTMKLEEGNPVRVPFEGCNDETCTARATNGYAKHDNGDNEDVFQKFLTLDHVLFLFVYPDGSHKSVAVPLFSFQEQYKNL